MKSRRIAIEGLWLTAGALLVALAAPLRAQDAPDSLVAEAMRRRDGRAFPEAARLLREALRRDSTRGTIHRHLAETLYWMGDRKAALRAYEEGLTIVPGDRLLALDYARFLAETSERRRAVAFAQPLVRDPETRARALALLGTIAYWSGDLPTARERLAAALAVDPALPDARRMLGEINESTAPWVTLAGGARADDQPLDSYSAGVQGGWSLPRGLTVSLRGEASRRVAEADTIAFGAGELALAHYAPALRLETELAGGGIRRSRNLASDWTGRAGLGLRLPGHVAVRAHVARRAYLATVASLTTPLMTRTLGGSLRLDHPRGWLGEVAVAAERFPDANSVRSTHAWLLAPVMRAEGSMLQVGWAAGVQDARELRFVPGTTPPTGPGFGRRPARAVDGRYEPYFTPVDMRAQSALVALTLRPTRRIALRASGAYAVTADDLAPTFADAAGGTTTDGTATAPVLYARDFRQWDARASLDARLSERLLLGVAGETGRIAFYSWSMATVQLTWRFVPRPARGAR